MKKMVNGEEVNLTAQEVAEISAQESAWVAGAMKDAARARINAARDAAIASGVTFGGVLYDSDPASREALTATLTVLQPGGVVPPGFTWRAADNTDHALSLAELQGLAAAMLNHGYAQHLQARQRKAQIEAAQSAAEIAAVTWEA